MESHSYAVNWRKNTGEIVLANILPSLMTRDSFFSTQAICKYANDKIEVTETSIERTNASGGQVHFNL